MKTSIAKPCKPSKHASSEYRFDYSKAKPNRFARVDLSHTREKDKEVSDK